MPPFDIGELIMNSDEVGLRRLVDALNADPPDPRIEPERGYLLHVLAVAHLQKYEETSRRDFLESALSLLRRSIDEGGAAEWHSYDVANLATALMLEYQLTGQLSTLEEAIAASRQSVSLDPQTGDERAGRLSTLGHLLEVRATSFNSAGDLDEAIGRLEESVRVPDVSDQKRSECWSNLAGALRDRYERYGNLDALRQAVTALRRSVDAAPDGSQLERDNRVNLAGAIRTHAIATGDLTDLDQSIRDIEAIVNGVPHDDPSLRHYLHNLGMGYLVRARRTGGIDDLRRAQSALRDALERTSPEHQKHASIGLNLAEAYSRDAERSEQALDLHDMIVDHPSAPAGVRFEAAETAGYLRLAAGNTRDALLSLSKAVDLLPSVAWRGSTYQDRQTAVGERSGTGAAAAACAIAENDPAAALDLLETGRAILWRQLIEARTDLKRIGLVRPDLADRLEAVQVQLGASHHP
jgi:tetratricopeptide (TPR) repeat protein